MFSKSFQGLSLLVVLMASIIFNCDESNAQSNFNSFQQPGTNCYEQSKSYGINFEHCEKALRKISYDSNGNLDNSSKTVFVWHKSCVVKVQKATYAQPSRQQVEYGVRNLLQTCPTRGGIYIPSNDFRTYVYSSNRENVYNLNSPVCIKHQCHINPNDCLMAFNNIPLSTKGFFLPSGSTSSNVIKTSSGNCTVKLVTTDGAGFRINHPEINSGIKTLLSKCGSRPGYNYFGGGSLGMNGDIKIITQNSYNNGQCN
ncbi:hypothetical protein BY996DRAFT_6408253 [Phakopsora pachyrhizi]|nr:hypothetical protein BY996DRAFT_6408253 [Phakopsora pachyrhizi]